MLPASFAEAQVPEPPLPNAPPSGGNDLRLRAPDSGTNSANSGPAPRDGRGMSLNSRAPVDPTMPSPALRELIDQGTTTRPGTAAPAPQQGVPEIRIRARVFTRDRPPIAVLEIGGRQLTIRKDSEIHIPGTADQPTGLQLKVLELSPTELRLEVLKRNQIISLN
ncbi:MAG: hypothetical protein C0483_19275 [Pirellula sp.]|nr:hypothetical protein [Pirellula sp.]